MKPTIQTGIGLAALGLAVLAPAAKAQTTISNFTGYYAPGNFSSFGDVSFAGDDSALTVTANPYAGTTITAPSTGLVKFTDTVTGNGAYFEIATPNPDGSETETSYGLGTGTQSFAVSAGQTFGFLDFGSTLSSLSVTQFSAPSPSPEPSSVSLLALTALGLGGLLLRARRRSAA